MIIGWIDPNTGRKIAWDDFGAFENILPVGVLRAITYKDQVDVRHQGPRVTVTGGLGCARKTAIQRMLQIHVDPVKMWAVTRGTWLHEQVGNALTGEPGWVTEESDPDACTFEGEIFGVRMSCKIDARTEDFSELIDYKFRGDYAARFLDPSGEAKPEDAAQMNMARLLMEQTTGRDLSDMRIDVWVNAGLWYKTRVTRRMNEEEIGRLCPGGGKYTVKEIFGFLDTAFKSWLSEADARGVAPADVPVEIKTEIIRRIPLVGLTMFKKIKDPSATMCTLYCELQNACDTIEGGV